MKLSSLTFQHKKWLEDVDFGCQIDLNAVTLEPEQITTMSVDGAIFDSVTFKCLEFLNCGFTAARFFDCIFQNCIFIHCSLHKAEFHNCRFLEVGIKGCSLTRSEWYQGELTSAKLSNCDFGWSYLQAIDLRYSALNDINLEGAIWDACKVYGAHFESINFGCLHPARIQAIDISPAGDGTIEVTLQQLREMFGI
jgi:uncharacterized protein YjbI with pentapeptide repeats